jgi:hypothetical protein
MKVLKILLFLVSMPLQAVELDKFKHLTAGMLVGGSISSVTDFQTGVSVGCAVGVAKELMDSVVDPEDAAYTCAGAALTSWMVHSRSPLYAANASLIILDGLSTSMAINNGAREVGPLAVALFGDTPSDLQITTLTLLNLSILEWSESWHPLLKQSYRWTLLLTRPGVININIQNSF